VIWHFLGVRKGMLLGYISNNRNLAFIKIWNFIKKHPSVMIDLYKHSIYNLDQIMGGWMNETGICSCFFKRSNQERQMKKMLDLGIEERMIFVDKQSGKDFERPGYKAMKRIIREGDNIYFDSLDRLGRDYDGVIHEWKYITRDLKADIIVLENASLFDSRKFREMGDMGRLMEDQFLSLLAYVADQERKKIKQRQAEGIALAKKNGKHMGRPKKNLHTLTKTQLQLMEENYPRWKAKEITAVEFMRRVEVKKNTFYKIIKEYENALEHQEE
jgi:DNA invertase Pin-like site-specific DNA recombinase